MLNALRTRWQRFGLAVLSVVVATLLRLAVNPVLGSKSPYFTYFLAVILTAWACGLWPALLAVLLGALAAAYFFVPPTGSLIVHGIDNLLALIIFVMLGSVIALLSEAMRRARARAEATSQTLRESREQLSTTLKSIGDAVIATNAGGQVTFMNGVAQALTGWEMPQAQGRQLEEVFSIVNEVTRQRVESPVTKVIREDKIVGLASHSLLLAKGGREIPIDDSSAPIRDEKGGIIGVVLVFHDITERRRAEETLRKSEERYRSFVQNSSEAIWRCELEQPISIDLPEDEIIEQCFRYGYLAECNDVMAEMYGFASAEDIVGTRLSDLLVPTDAANTEYLRAFIRSGFRLGEAESHEIDREGRQKYFLNNLVGIIENRMLLRTWGTQRDITERRAAEETRSRLAAIVESSDDAISGKTLEGILTSWNKGAQQMYGYSAKEIIGQSVSLIVPPERYGELSGILEKLRQGGRVEHLETVRVRKDGTKVNVSISISPIKDAGGEVIGAATIARDITERQRAEQERSQLLEREQAARELAEQAANRTARLQAITAALSEALTPVQVAAVVLNQGLNAIGASAGSVALLSEQGTELELLDAVGFPPELVEPWRRFSITEDVPIANAVRTGKLVLIESLAEREKSYPKLVALHTQTNNQALVAIPLIVEGRAVGAMGLSFSEAQNFSEEVRAFMLAMGHQCAQAITRARLYEAERRARAEAEAANRTKDEFLATLSHELRTPLTAMLGWTRLLRTLELDAATATHALETIERNARAQAQLIEDLLDVSRIITGNLRLELHPVELVPVIKAAVEAVRPAAAVKAIDLQTELDPLAGLASGDPARLQQVIWNLVSNAVKFTGSGGQVLVRLRRAGSHLQLSVSDTGEGIKPEFLPFVFDRFRQADGSTTRLHGGLGLGLAIVRHLIELHGGTVKAESAGFGQGATFTVTLPLLSALTSATVVERGQEATGNGTHAEQGRQLNELRVLVVDDEQDARQLLTVVLEKQGANVRAVASASEALDLISTLKPHMLVSDIGMPGDDGYALIRRIRALSAEQGGQTPAIALTAYAGDAARAQSLAAGFQLHLAKPIDPTELLTAITSLVETE